MDLMGMVDVISNPSPSVQAPDTEWPLPNDGVQYWVHFPNQQLFWITFKIRPYDRGG
jgi:hypothetical protein